MTCWICKRTEDNFKSLNENALNELENALLKLKKGLDEITEKLNTVENDEQEKKYLTIAKGHLKKKVKILNRFIRILTGAFSDYCISNNNYIEASLASSAKRFLSESFAGEYILAPLKLNTEVKICYYCKEIIEQISFDNSDQREASIAITELLKYIEENIPQQTLTNKAI